MHRKDEHGRGDFEDAFGPVPHASDFRMILALATQNSMHCEHIHISQAFVHGDFLPGDGYNGKVYISPPPGLDEDPNYVYKLRRPLHGMPSADSAWHHTISAYLKYKGHILVGFERSMWTVVKDGHVILIRPWMNFGKLLPPPLSCTFLKVYMELGSYFLFLQEQIKDIIIIRL
jgi:hypothetical protein